MSDKLHPYKKQSFKTDIEVNAKVERHKGSSNLAAQGNRALRSIGSNLNPIPGTVEYIGSAAVHIYKSPMLEQMFFVAQTDTLSECPEHIASKGITDLRGAAMEHYGRRRATKRSGF